MSNPDHEGPQHAVEISPGEAQVIEQVNSYILDATVQQNVNTLLQYFQLAWFLRKVAEMSSAEFELLCGDTKRLIQFGLGENNKKIQALSPQIRARAQMAGLIPEPADISNAMRYFVEARTVLLSLRNKSKGG